MLRSILLVLCTTLAAAFHATARKQARALAVREHIEGENNCPEGVTTTPVLIYANMDRGNQLYSLRGSSEQESELEDSDSQESELEMETEDAEPAANETDHVKTTPLCLAIYRSLRTFEKSNDLVGCMVANKQATGDAAIFLQRFDENSAQESLQPAYAKCIHQKVNVATAQLAQSGGCMEGLTKDFVEFHMKNKGRGVSMQCRAEACLKYKGGNDKKIMACQEKFDDELDKTEDLKGAASVYERLLHKCAGVSEVCARQNGWPMAWKANQQMLKSIGLNGIR